MRLSLIFPILFLGIFLAIGFGLLGYSLWMIKRSSEVALWPNTPGKLVHCELTQRTASKGGTVYEVVVNYQYNVAGQDYTSTRLAFGYNSSTGREGHSGVYEKLSRAREIEVRYDPNDPSSAVLSYGTHRSIQFMLAFAITWLVFIAGFCVIWYIASQPDHILMQNLLVR